MTIYQKAFKVKKECEYRVTCNDCDECNYYIDCKNSNYFILYFFAPADESIEKISKVIKEEKWNVK